MVLKIKTYRLDELAVNESRSFDFTGRDSVVFVNTGDVLEGRFLHSNRALPEGLPGQAKKRIENGDILFSEIRPGNKRFARVDFDADDYVVSTKFIVFRLTSDIVDPTFFYIQITSDQTLSEFQRIAESRSGTFPQITFDAISYYPISVPPISKQIAVVRIISSIDRKIELNRQINQTLESMAQALFKSWFVDFDQVIDNALAAGNEIPEPFAEKAAARQTLKEKAIAGDSDHPTLPEEIRQLFPSAFQFTEELGWIPEGWNSQPVYDVAKLINGASFKSKHFTNDKSGLPIIKIVEIKNGVSGQTKYTSDVLDSKYYVNNGDVLFSWSGNPDTSIDTFIWAGGQGWLNQHVFKVVMHSKQDRSYVYCLLKLMRPVFAEIARDKQTTGLGHVTAGDLKRLQVVKPSNDALLRFGELADSILEKWFLNLQQRTLLGSMRDLLLPKLLSGELRIPDAEELAAEAEI